MLTHTLPMGQTASQVYDSFGRIFRKVDFKGQTNEFIYDSLGRVATNRFYAQGSSTPSNTFVYSYNAYDIVNQVIGPSGTNALNYSDDGKLLQISSPEGTVNYEYEPVESRRTRVYTTNTDLRYSYDELGRVKTVSVYKREGVTLGTPEVTTNTYTALGSLQDVYYPNGVHALYQYDLMNRLTNLVYTSGSGQLMAQYIYASNTNGQWKTATEIQWQSGTSFSTNQVAWFYDNLGRLTNETCSSTATGLSYTNRYVFNLLGNRLWQTNIVGGTTQVTGYTYDTNDQLLAESGAVSFTNLYDANGSLTNRASGAETNGYVFNLQNRLASATINRVDSGHSISETINFTYDYNGRRVRAQWSRSVDGGAAVNRTNIFLHEPYAPSGVNDILEELPANGATPSATYTLGSRIVSQKRNGTISHLMPDGHGSTRQLADSSAAIAARFSFDAYGKALDFANNTQNPAATPFLYSGGQNDADLQLYNFGARYYNAAAGRFGQIDPFSENQENGANLYIYCENDPVNNSDLRGLYEIDVHQFLTRFLAESAGFGSFAEDVGNETQLLDAPGDPRDAMSGGPEMMRAFHFVNRKQLGNLRRAAVHSRQYGGAPPAGHPWQRVGEYLHALEDTYAHCTGVGDRNWEYHGNIKVIGFTVWDNGGRTGHGHLGHEPDHTWRDGDKAMKMAEEVYSQIQAFAPPGSTAKDWSAIKGTIRDFVDYAPNVYKQYLPKYHVTVENATFDGYNTKIRKLNGAYGIDEAVYANPDDPVFAKVAGQRPSKTIAGATRGLSFAPVGVNIIFGPFIGIQ